MEGQEEFVALLDRFNAVINKLRSFAGAAVEIRQYHDSLPAGKVAAEAVEEAYKWSQVDASPIQQRLAAELQDKGFTGYRYLPTYVPTYVYVVHETLPPSTGQGKVWV